MDGGNPQGTLVLATDLSAASRLFRQAGIAQPELYVGELPGDPRAFNAVCVCPPPASIPGGYRRVVLAGMPAEYPGLCGETAFELYALDDRPAWMRLLPDIVQMREAYRAMMRVAGRPVRFHTMEQLAYLVAEEAGYGPSNRAGLNIDDERSSADFGRYGGIAHEAEAK